VNLTKSQSFASGVLVGAIGSLILCLWLFELDYANWNKQAIERGYKYYDEKTGKLLWRDPVTRIDSGCTGAAAGAAAGAGALK
jgi:hypothetical protein